MSRPDLHWIVLHTVDPSYPSSSWHASTPVHMHNPIVQLYVCMCVCVCVCTAVCKNACMFSLRACTYAHVPMSVCLPVGSSVCDIHVRMSISPSRLAAARSIIDLSS